MESFVLKADRGRAVHSDHMLDVDYWVERNFNTDTDDSIAALAAPSRTLRDELMNDSALADLHRQSVAWRTDRFHELMLQEPMRALFARLLMTPPSRPVSAGSARTLTRYATQSRKIGKQSS